MTASSPINGHDAFVIVSSFFRRELEPEGFISIVDGRLSPEGYHDHGQRMVNQLVTERIRLDDRTIDPFENPLEWLQYAERLSGGYVSVSEVISGSGSLIPS